MAGKPTKVTQLDVSAAVEAFWQVHGRRPAYVHLKKMLGASSHTLTKFNKERVPMRVRRVWLERARAIHLRTAEEISRQKAEAGKLGAKAHGMDAGLQVREFPTHATEHKKEALRQLMMMHQGRGRAIKKRDLVAILLGGAGIIVRMALRGGKHG